MRGAGEAQIRRSVARQGEKEESSARSSSMMQEVMDAIGRPPVDIEQTQIIGCVKRLTAVVVHKEARQEHSASNEKRLKIIELKERHVGFLQKHGTPDMITLAVAELGKFYQVLSNRGPPPY